jgi:hypothetical protein
MAAFESLYFPAQIKLGRARHHLGNLTKGINEFLARRPFRLVMRVDPKLREAALHTKAIEQIPSDFPLIIGDTIHNLRSALDITMYALASPRAKVPEKIAFPFAKSETGLDGSIGRAQASYAGTKVVEAIRQIRPFPGGNDTLCAIHDLNILDKHRLLVLARRIPELSFEQVSAFLDVTMVNGTLIFSGPEDEALFKGPITIGATRVERRLAAKLQPYEKEIEGVNPVFHIAFGEEQPCGRQYVIETLSNAVELVDQAVRDLIVAYVDSGNTFPT